MALGLNPAEADSEHHICMKKSLRECVRGPSPMGGWKPLRRRGSAEGLGRRYVLRRPVERMFCMTELKKQVLPRFCRPLVQWRRRGREQSCFWNSGMERSRKDWEACLACRALCCCCCCCCFLRLWCLLEFFCAAVFSGSGADSRVSVQMTRSQVSRSSSMGELCACLCECAALHSRPHAISPHSRHSHSRFWERWACDCWSITRSVDGLGLLDGPVR